MSGQSKGESSLYCLVQLCGRSASCGEPTCCGERACPALGCVAAPSHSPRFYRHDAAFLLGLLRSPTRGKPARHRECFMVVRFLCRLPPAQSANCAVKTSNAAESAVAPYESAFQSWKSGLPWAQSGRPERSQARFLCCARGCWARRANRSFGSARSGTSSSSLPTSSALATSST